MRQALHRLACQGGVGGDDALDAVPAQCIGNGLHLAFIQVGRDLEEKRHLPAVLGGQLALARLQRRQQGIQRGLALQLAQVLGVGAGDVHRHVVGVGVHAGQADQIVVGGALDRRGRVLADVKTQNHALTLIWQARGAMKTRVFDVADEGVQPLVVEAQAVDQRVLGRQAEHAWLGVAGLRQRRDGAHLDKAEAHGRQGVDGARVLVQPRGQADAVGKAQARQRHRITHALRRPGALQRRALAARQHVEREFVRRFRVHAEQQGARQTVGEQGHRIILVSTVDVKRNCRK